MHFYVYIQSIYSWGLEQSELEKLEKTSIAFKDQALANLSFDL